MKDEIREKDLSRWTIHEIDKLRECELSEGEVSYLRTKIKPYEDGDADLIGLDQKIQKPKHDRPKHRQEDQEFSKHFVFTPPRPAFALPEPLAPGTKNISL